MKFTSYNVSKSDLQTESPSNLNFYALNSASEVHIKLNWYYALLFFAFWITLYLAVVVPVTNMVPEAYTMADEINHPDEFIAERAEQILLNLTSIGPKVVGSNANNVLTIEFLLAEIHKIQVVADNYYVFEIDIQSVSGNYIHWSMVNMYQGMLNVIVKLSTRDSQDEQNYLLLNSHFDTAPTSYGGGDDGAMVATMLETMRVLTKTPRPLQHPVIFLFNGAEENPLQASHGFITQHKWAPHCKALINMDATGVAGREMVFQSAPNNPWIMQYYRGAPHPFSTTLAEELFQRGLIPSDTDFSIFTKYANIAGLDMAFIYNGYVYHTKFDRGTIVKRASLQNVGDNLLYLVQTLSNAPEMKNPEAHRGDDVVFFSIFNHYLILYTKTFALFLDLITCAIALISIAASLYLMSKSSGRTASAVMYIFGQVCALQIFSLALGIMLSLLVAMFMDAVNRTQSWFTELWLIIMLYFCPMLFGMGLLPAIYAKYCKNTLTLGNIVQMFMHAHCLFLIFIIILLIIFGVRMTFTFTFSVLFYTLALLINLTIRWQSTAFKFAITVFISQILPFLIWLQIAQMCVQCYVPMTGRSGAIENPDLVMAVVGIFFSILTAGFLVPILLLFRRTIIIISCFLAATIFFICFAVTSIVFPFKAETSVQTFSFIHTQRIFHNFDKSIRLQDAGVYFYPQNRRSNTADAYISTLGKKLSLKSYCEVEMLCGMPHLNHRYHNARENNFWIPVDEQPILPSIRAELNLISQTELTTSTQNRFTFNLSGPDHMTLFIGIKNEAEIIDWSFNNTMLVENWQPPFFIYFSYGNDSTPLEFTIDVQKSSANFSNASLEIGIGSHWIHHAKTRTAKMQHFVEEFPKFGNVIDWVASYETWLY